MDRGWGGARQIDTVLLGQVSAGLVPQGVEGGRDEVIDDVVGRVVDALLLATTGLAAAIGKSRLDLVKTLGLGRSTERGAERPATGSGRESARRPSSSAGYARARDRDPRRRR
jgi:hypothetical protein